jgi:hypothetical protein
MEERDVLKSLIRQGIKIWMITQMSSSKEQLRITSKAREKMMEVPMAWALPVA